jgi:hypothetical protein
VVPRVEEGGAVEGAPDLVEEAADVSGSVVGPTVEDIVAVGKRTVDSGEDEFEKRPKLEAASLDVCVEEF